MVHQALNSYLHLLSLLRANHEVVPPNTFDLEAMTQECEAALAQISSNNMSEAHLARLGVYYAIDAERAYQDRKWGTLQQHPHEVGSWILLMETILFKAKTRYMRDKGNGGALDELRKVVSVGVACMEQHGVVTRFDPKDFMEH